MGQGGVERPHTLFTYDHKTTVKSMKNPQLSQGDDVISLADLRAKREELREAIMEIDEAIEAFENVLGSGFMATRQVSSSASQMSIFDKNDDYSNLSIYEATVKILCKKKQILSTNEVYDALLKGGKKIEGGNPRTVVATTLYKSVKKKKNCKIAVAGKGKWKSA